MRLHLILLAALCSFSFALTDSEAAKILERLRAENVNRPISEAMAKRLNGGFWKTWAGSNGSDCSEFFTPELAEQRVKAFKDAGYIGIVVSGRHWRLDNLACTPDVTRHLKLISDTAHRYGMFVISHFDLVQFSAGGLDFALQHPDWWSVELQTHTPHTKFCLSNPGFRQFYIDYLAKLVRESGVDGFMLDEVSFAQEDRGVGTCACKICRADFERDTGLPFAESMNAPEWTSHPNPWFEVFSQWRVNAVNRFQAHITGALKKEFPELMFVSYSTAFLEPEMKQCGFSFPSHFKYMDSLGVEPPQGSTVKETPRLITRCKLRLGVGDALDKPTWALAQTPQELKDNLFYMCGFYKMFRHTIWSPRDLSPALTAWTQWPDPANTRAVAAAALVFSEPTLISSFDSRGDGYWQQRELEGWAGALSARNLTYDVLIAEAITPKTLARYPVVILPNTAILTVGEQQALSDYLTQGGVILTSGRFGYDKATGKSGIRPAIEIPMPKEHLFVKPTPLANGILAKTAFTEAPVPEFRTVGRGALGVIPAVVLFAESWISPQEGVDLSANRKFLDEWLAAAFAKRPPEAECRTPSGVLPEILRDTRGSLICCLLDLNGRTRENGETYVKKELKGSITLTVRKPTRKSTFRLQSPGREDWTVPVTFTRENGTDTYTFSAAGLPIYTQIKVDYE